MKCGNICRKMVLLSIVVAAFALRLAYLLHSHPFIDEFTTLLAARAILARGLPVLPSGLFYEHGLPFTYLDAPFVGLAGDRWLFVAARLPSLVIGTATVPLLYWIGRRWFSPRAGLVAAALFAFSPEGMVWGGRARMYALAQLLALLLACLVYEGSRREGRQRLRWLALLTLLAALLTQFGAIILVPPLVIGGLVVGWLTRSASERPWFLRRAVLAEGAALAVVIGLGVLVKRLGQPLGAAPLGDDGAGDLLAELIGIVTYQTGLVLDGSAAVKFLAQQFGVPHHLWLALIAVVSGLLGLTVWIVARKKSASLLPTPYSSLYLWLVFGLAVVEMVTLLESWRRNPRYLVMALPLFYLLVTASLEQISNIIFQISNIKFQISNFKFLANNKWRMTGFSLRGFFDICHLMFVISFVAVQAILLVPDLRIAYRTPEPAYEEAFQYVADQWRPGDVLLTMNTSAAGLYLGQADQAYRFAIQQDAAQFLLNADTQPVDRWLGASWVGTAGDFNRTLNEHPRVWFVVDTIRQPVYYRGDWLALLKTQMELVWSRDEALVYRTRSDRSPLPTAPAVTVNADLGGLVRLVGYQVDCASSPAACECDTRAHQKACQVALFWTPLAPISDDYTVFVHVRDATRATVAQRDSQPLGGDYPTHQWRAGETVIDPYRIDLPADLPPGQYRIIVGMYRLATMQRLPVAGDTSGENAVVLGEVTLP